MNGSVARYNRLARTLHWIIAALIVANLLTGLFHDALKPVWQPMPFHKASGLTILALSLVRLGWRLKWRMPGWPDTMGLHQRRAAHAVHALFYGLMIAMPLTGWAMSSAGTYPLTWFGLFGVPRLPVTKGSTAFAVSHESHELMGWLFVALLALHIGAAVHHRFVVRDGVLRRML
ncbi:cytochrome b [Novosphingobium lentum]|uniref:cytochrome b n=1 Tax=Novosphingobium lentum TaxID=145287 RepID=UPI0008367A08|nr:cytochrome b [Novosphingobium lentum]